MDKTKPVDLQAFEIFAKLHPVGAYDSNPVEFCNYFRRTQCNLTDDKIKEIIDSCR